MAITAKQIKEDLLDQLERNGTVGNQYIDLVNDYVDLWKTKNMLKRDIKKRGINVTYQNGENQHGSKKNDSVDQLIKINMQMLKLLGYLKLKPGNADGDPDDDEM